MIARAAKKSVIVKIVITESDTDDNDGEGRNWIIRNGNVATLGIANRPLWSIFGNHPTYRLIFAITGELSNSGISNKV